MNDEKKSKKQLIEELKELREKLSGCNSREITGPGRDNEIHNNQDFLNQILDLSPSIIYIYDLVKQRNVYANREIYDILGYSIEKIQKMGTGLFLEIAHPDDLEAIADHHERISQSAGNDIFELQYRIKHADGHYRWLLSRDTVFLRDTEGNPAQLIGTAVDITNVKNREDELLIFRKYVESSRQGLGIAYPDGTGFYANPALIKLYGEDSLENIVGKSFIRFFPDDMIEKIRNEVIPAVYRNGQWSGELTVKTKSNARIPTLHVYFLIADDKGKPLYIAASVTDISEQKKAEKELQEAREELEGRVRERTSELERVNRELQQGADIIKNMQLGIHIYHLENRDNDASLRMVLTNPASEKLTGVKIEDVVGKTLDENFPGLREKGIPQKYAGVVRTKEPFEMIDFYYGDDRVLFSAFSVKAFPLPNDHVGVTFENVTDRIIAEEKIKASLSEKEILLKEIHHRVKNNLQIISSLLGLQEGYIINDHDRELFIDSQNRILAMALVHEKLYQSENISSINFSDYLESLVSELSQAADIRDGNIEFIVNVDNVFLDIDTAIPCALIINELVTNSIKHAFPGDRHGTVALDFKKDGKDDYVLTVSDNGAGLPDEFDIESRSTLGVKLIRALASQLKGRLVLDGQGGTTTKLTFSSKNK